MSFLGMAGRYRNDVDQVIASFTKTLQELDRVVAEKNEQAEIAKEAQLKAIKERGDALTEVRRAAAIRNNIETLIKE